MRKLSSLALVLALLAAPAVLAEEKHPACTGKPAATEKKADAKCDPAQCKKTCSADEKAKCPQHKEAAKPEASKSPKS